MHGVLLSVQKLLLTLWFSPAFSKEHFSISSRVENVDERLNQISPTFEIKRLPRSISEHLRCLHRVLRARIPMMRALVMCAC